MNSRKNISHSALDGHAELQRQLDEALDALEAIRTGQVDALVVQDGSSHELYTLQSADRAYRSFIEKMSEGAVTLHRDGTIEYANVQFGELLQRPLTGLIGRPFAESVAATSLVAFDAIVSEAVRSQSCRGEIELDSGTDAVPVQISLSILHAADSFTMPMIVTDLRQQKKVQQQLLEQNRALMASNYDLQQFASVASHDLQEPLRKISTFTNLLLDQKTTVLPERMQGYLSKIGVSASRMQQLIIDVLNFSRLSAGSTRVVETDLNVLINELLEDFELVIEQKHATVEVAPLPTIAVQPVQMTQALRNLISNALKFSKPGTPPVVRISGSRLAQFRFDSALQTDGPYCLLTIRDNGIGFNEEYLDKIFGLFQRLHSRDSYEGTGIGLAITKKIIEQHNGLIEAWSSPNGGAEFRVLLPIRPTPPGSA